MQNKLQELTEKIYSEGVEKGNEEASKIVSDAKSESERIIKEANEKAVAILNEAEKKAHELNENTKSELKLASKQILNAVKQNITNTVTAKTVTPSVKDALEDKDFLKNIIEKIASNWNINDPGSSDLNVFLPEKNKKELDSYFKKEASDLLKKGISFQFSSSLKSGFQISPKDGGYKISFLEEEFENYFKEYLRPKLIELLFDE